MVHEYNKVRRSSYRAKLNEVDDCSVVALALACEVSYEEAHSWLIEQGRELCGSTSIHSVLTAARENGFRVDRFSNVLQPNGSRYTQRPIGKFLKTGKHLCSTRDHIFAVIDGVVEDWTHGKFERIQLIYDVIKLTED